MASYYTRFDLSYFDFYDALNRTRQLEPLQDYILVSTVDELPITVDQVMEHLKLDGLNAESTPYYESLISASTMCAEYMMRREIINKQFRTFVSCFRDGLILKRGRLITVDLVAYLNADNSWATVDSSGYYFTQSNTYSRLYSDPNTGWPSINNSRQQAVKVEFTAGMGTPCVDNCPHDIQLALLHHIAVLHEQRGDWGSADLGVSQLIGSVPSFSRIVYNKYRIINQ